MNASALARASAAVNTVCAPPLSMMADWNSPSDDGAARSAQMFFAPAESPPTVMRSGSPPKSAIVSPTHASAA